MDISDLLTLLLGGGMVATLSAAFNGIKSLREGSRKKERDTITDLIVRRDEAYAERDKAYRARDRAFNERDYWRDWAGQLEYTCRQSGTPLPEKPALPKETA